MLNVSSSDFPVNFHEIDRRRNPRLELGNVGIAVRKCVRCTTSQQRAGDGRMPVGFSHLLLQAVHGG
jgi:hypothetical protein